MSSVLKALKKLEDEKRGTAPPSSAAANQRWASGGQPERSQRPWLFVTAGLAVGLLVAGILLWFGRKEVPVATVPVAASTVPVIPQPSRAVVETSVPPAQSSPPVVASKIEPPAVRPVPEQSVVETPRAATVVVASPPPPPPTSTVIPARSIAPMTIAEIPVKQVQVERLEIPAPGQQWVAPPQLVVTEIFPATGEGRMAIVNGLPVMAGTMVEEALVEEIHDDRVVVSIGGRRVVLSLGRGR